MPEQPDNPSGRMLFTEFDVSDKGRPVAVLPPGQPPGFIPGPLHSITELASSLDFGFEDDESDIPPPPPDNMTGDDDPGGEGSGEPSLQSDLLLPPGEDGELSLEQALYSAGVHEYAAPAPVAPTWEEYLKALRSPRTRDEMGEVSRQPPPPPEATGSPSSAASVPFAVDSTAPTAAYPAVGGDDEDIDVLSALWFEGAEDQPVSRERSVPPPPPVPYGGVERVEDWFDPPENQYEPPPPSRDWFEPPDKPFLPDGAGQIPGGRLDADARDDGPTRRMEHPPTRNMSPSDSIFDIFADVDVDALWRERLATAGAPADSQSTDTRSIDLFSGIDLDELWEARTGQSPAGSHTDLFPREEGGASATDPNDTVILDDEAIDIMAASFPEAVREDDRSHAPQAETAEAPPLPPPPETDGALSDDPDELDELLEWEDSAPLPEGAEAEDAGNRDAAGKDFAAKAGSDSYLDVMDEFETGVHDVVAPQVDNAAIESGVKRRKRAMADAAESASASTPTGLPRSGDEAEPDAGEEGSEQYIPEADGGNMDDQIAPEEVEGDSPPSSATPKRGLVTDDLLDIDFGDMAVNADVAAPVIDDSAIDPLQRGGPRPGTEEMQAIADGGEAAAVNPMDVFANMDDMDFSDDMDDDMRAMMDEEEEDAGVEADAEDLSAAAAARVEPVPKSLVGKARYYAKRALRRVVPMSLLERLDRMVAWGDNWWFYCDLLAAIIASASLAVIISYYVWYRV